MNVARDKTGLERMLAYSKGSREVPVIVDGENVILGYGGGS